MEGNAILEEETAKKKKMPPSAPVTKPVAAKSKSPNVYAQARETILSAMSPKDRSFIESLETEGKTDHHRYKAFVNEIMKLGDKLSEKSS